MLYHKKHSVKRDVLQLIYVAGNCLNDNSFIKDTYFLRNETIQFTFHPSVDEMGLLSSCSQRDSIFNYGQIYASTYDLFSRLIYSYLNLFEANSNTLEQAGT